MSITNAERIATMIAEDPNTVKIHTVPNSQYWIVMFVTKKTFPNWRCVLCNPELTTWRLVTQNITPDEHWELYNKLIEAHISNKFSHYLSELKKTTIQFKSQQKTYDNKLQRTHRISKERST